MSFARYVPAGYQAVLRHDITFEGASAEYLDLLQKTVAVSAHAHYMRTPLPGSRVGCADEKLQHADSEAVVRLSSWLRGQMEHLASHLDAFRILLLASGGETPYSTTAPHLRAVIEDAADILWVLWPSRSLGPSLSAFGELAAEDFDNLAKSERISPHKSVSADDVTRMAHLREQTVSSVAGTYRSAKKRTELRESLSKHGGGAEPRFNRIVKTFPSNAERAAETASVWRRLSADSHYSAAWDQHFLSPNGPVDRRDDLRRSFITVLEVLDILLRVTRETLEEPAAGKKLEPDT